MLTSIEQIQIFLDNILSEEPELFCVSLKIKPTNNIKIFVDGDNGVTIEKCVRINRRICKSIEETAMYPDGDYSMEVSSPGVDEPLKLNRQYKKNIGRFLEIELNDESKKEGKLLEANETDIVVETIDGKGKKAVTQQITIAFTTIKKAVVQIRF